MSTTPHLAPHPPSGLALGIDIGGTGIKGAVVDVQTGTLVSDRFRLDTPQPSTPDNVADTVAEIAAHFDFTGPTGVAYPGVVLDGIARTAANLHPAWIDTSLVDTIAHRLPGPATFLNDADAAGVAETRYGAARNQPGVVLVVTLGTGIGVAMINNGELVANSELGHIEMHGVDAETIAAASAKHRHGQDWAQWATGANHYLKTLENLVWPKLIVLGGGITKTPETWLDHLTPRTPVVLAHNINNAGIIGAAAASLQSTTLQTR